MLSEHKSVGETKEFVISEYAKYIVDHTDEEIKIWMDEVLSKMNRAQIFDEKIIN
jgi:hypothetical protein